MRSALLAGAALVALLPTRQVHAAQLTYTAQVESTEVAADTPFALQLTIGVDGNTGIDDLTLPDVGALRILGNSRSEGTTVQLGSGAPVFRKTIRITMTLMADRPGTVTIGKGRLRAGGQTVETQPITMRVLPSGTAARRVPQAAQPAPPPSMFPDPQGDPMAQPGPADDPVFGGVKASPQAMRSGLFATLEADKERVTLGEQITLTVRIYSRTDLSDIDALRLPKLEGFWTEELENPRRISPTMVLVDGQRWQSYLLRRLAIFPTRAGEFEVAAVEADVTTGGSFFSAGRRHRVQSQPLNLTVEPLPAEGQPPGFQPGNVGVFDLDVKMDREQVALSQPVTVTVRVRGRGNLRQVSVPRIPETQDIRVYDPTPSEDIQARNAGFEGHKTLEFLVQPRRAGRIRLPPIAFSYFNPDTDKYVTIPGPELVITVAEDAGKGGAAVNPKGNVLAAQARPMRVVTASQRPLPTLSGHPSVPLFLGAPLFIGLGALALGSTLRRRRESRARDIGTQAQTAIRELQQVAQAGTADALRAPLLHYLSLRVGPQVPGMTREELSRALTSRGLAPDDAQRLWRLLDDLDAAAYAPRSDARRGALADEAVAVVRAVEAALGGR